MLQEAGELIGSTSEDGRSLASLSWVDHRHIRLALPSSLSTHRSNKITIGRTIDGRDTVSFDWPPYTGLNHDAHGWPIDWEDTTHIELPLFMISKAWQLFDGEYHDDGVEVIYG